MEGVVIKPLEVADMLLLGQNMRPMDRLEYNAMAAGVLVEDGMRYMANLTERGQAAYVDGELLCCWGLFCKTVLANDCDLWMLATPLIETKKAKRLFIQQSKGMARDLLGDFSKGSNWVYEGNKTTIRWLKWLGATFDRDPMMFNGVRFVPFDLRKD